MIISVIIGAIIWLMFELNKAQVKVDYSFKKFISLNLVPFMTNLLCGLAVVWFRDEISDYLTINKFSAVMVGFTGQGVFKKFITIFDKNIETKFGINKPSN